MIIILQPVYLDWLGYAPVPVEQSNSASYNENIYSDKAITPHAPVKDNNGFKKSASIDSGYQSNNLSEKFIEMSGMKISGEIANTSAYKKFISDISK